MAASLISPSSSLSHFPSNLPKIRENQLGSSRRRECARFSKKTHVVVSSSSVPISAKSIQRRDLVLFGISTSAALLFPSHDLHAEIELDKDVKMALNVDDINAYSFLYPLELPAKKFTFKWVESRKPERYSSAAPLARSFIPVMLTLKEAPEGCKKLRSYLHDLFLCTPQIGPPNSRFLTSSDKSTWKAKDVADSVLSDKSALPVSTDQRMIESSVLDAHSSMVDGEPYWYYEYLVRKSPTQSMQGSNLYRHNVASTAERDGYLYSLNASTLSKQWDYMGRFLQQTVASFRLLPPTENYVPPYKDPWRFW